MFALGCVRRPQTSFVKILEYCIKDLKTFSANSYLFTISSKVVNFILIPLILRIPLMEINLAKLNRFSPFLKFPSVWVYNVFKLYSITELLCISSNYRLKFSFYNAEYLIRVGVGTSFSTLKGIGFKAAKRRRFNKSGCRVLAYYRYLKLLWTRSANIVCNNYELTTESARVRTFLKWRTSCLLCSGDCNFYSVLSLLQQCANVTIYSRVAMLPNVSSAQYLNVLLGSLFSSSCNIMSFSNIFNWIVLKRFIKYCANSCGAQIVYNPKANHRQRLLTYAINNNIVLSVYSTISSGQQLRTRFERVNTKFLCSVRLSIFNMLTIAFMCSKLMLLIKDNNTLNCLN
ncbi:precorrin-3B C17-methyltransferase [Candidatus Hodgkinia cicadicola]|nr:precorrin-3B C17-methyltransferase [Candidatus Hodgkinia cicadicola]